MTGWHKSTEHRDFTVLHTTVALMYAVCSVYRCTQLHFDQDICPLYLFLIFFTDISHGISFYSHYMFLK